MKIIRRLLTLRVPPSFSLEPMSTPQALPLPLFPGFLFGSTTSLCPPWYAVAEVVVRRRCRKRDPKRLVVTGGKSWRPRFSLFLASLPGLDRHLLVVRPMRLSFPAGVVSARHFLYLSEVEHGFLVRARQCLASPRPAHRTFSEKRLAFHVVLCGEASTTPEKRCPSAGVLVFLPKFDSIHTDCRGVAKVNFVKLRLVINKDVLRIVTLHRITGL